ncbi:DNA repair protein XRCC1-like [Penaeus indicus]|uniref:DNA repair protein XRCC1-like n=1 Tax=Penaeus indicus TaxID=29960 RepID=UPI00300D0EAD
MMFSRWKDFPSGLSPGVHTYTRSYSASVTIAAARQNTAFLSCHLANQKVDDSSMAATLEPYVAPDGERKPNSVHQLIKQIDSPQAGPAESAAASTNKPPSRKGGPMRPRPETNSDGESGPPTSRFPQFKVPAIPEGFNNAYQLVRALEMQRQIRLLIRVTRDQVSYDVELITSHPQVVEASRMSVGKTPTRQVMVTMKGGGGFPNPTPNVSNIKEFPDMPKKQRKSQRNKGSKNASKPSPRDDDLFDEDETPMPSQPKKAESVQPEPEHTDLAQARPVKRNTDKNGTRDSLTTDEDPSTSEDFAMMSESDCDDVSDVTIV